VIAIRQTRPTTPFFDGQTQIFGAAAQVLEHPDCYIAGVNALIRELTARLDNPEIQCDRAF